MNRKPVKVVALSGFTCLALWFGFIVSQDDVIVVHMTNVQVKEFAEFKPRISKHELAVYLEILKTFVKVMENNNLTYWLYSGSLLGSYRHHGMIPWDDDIDVTMPVQEMEKAFEVLNSYKPHFLLIRGKERWKFYSHKSRKIRRNIRWRFPFLDISFYYVKINNTKKIICDNDEYFPKFVYDYTDVFPLIKRPFEGLLLNAPHHTKKVLKTTYDLNKCVSNQFIHKIERRAKRQLVKKCEDLKGFFPFVSRKKTPKGTNETLEMNGIIKSWWLDKS